MGRNVMAVLEVDWDRDGVWTDESAYRTRARGGWRIVRPEDGYTGGRGTVPAVEVELSNADGRFSTVRDGAPLSPYIGDGKGWGIPVRIRVGLDGGAPVTVFTGVVAEVEERPPAADEAGTVVLRCRGREELLRQVRYTVDRTAFFQANSDGWTEADAIAHLLTAAGMVDGVDFVSQAYAQANPGATPTLDPGLWVIPWYVWNDEPILDAIWRLAGAAGGRFYTNRDGLFVYENGAAWQRNPAPVATVDRSGFGSYRALWDAEDLYNRVEIEYAPWFVDAEDVIWEAGEVLSVPANGGTLVHRAETDNPIYTVTAVRFTAVTSGGTDITGQVSMAYTVGVQTVEFTFTNNHPTAAAYITGLEVVGQAMRRDERRTVTAQSVDPFWTGKPERVRSVRGNPYYQTQAMAQAAADMLRDRHRLPRLFHRVSGMPGIPDLGPGDVLEIYDPEAMDNPMAGFVIGLTWSLDGSGYVQDVVLLDRSGLYPYQDTTPGYFILGTNTLGATSSSPGRFFY